MSKQYFIFGQVSLFIKQKKNLEVTKFKAFADYKLNVAKMMISLCDRLENTVGKGENDDYEYVFLSSQSLLF